MPAFAETVKRGSFAGAARELGLSSSAVAKSVARLEQDLGLRLLHRTTHQVNLTGDGSELYARCRRIVDEMEALRDEAEGVRGTPRGTLRLNLPITYGRQVVVPKLAALLRKYPDLGLDLSFSDRWVDLIRDGLDAVVRMGALADSALVARRIGSQHMILCAGTAYLKNRGVPKHPSELGSHDCLAFRLPTTGRPRPWQLREPRKGGREINFTPTARAIFDDGDALVQAVAQGMGLIQVPDYMAAVQRFKRLLQAEIALEQIRRIRIEFQQEVHVTAHRIKGITSRRAEQFEPAHTKLAAEIGNLVQMKVECDCHYPNDYATSAAPLYTIPSSRKGTFACTRR